MAFLSQTKTAGALASSDKVSRFALPRSWIYLLASACILIMFLNARDGLENLYFRWTHEDEYGYGFLIAGLVPFLLWRLWPALYVSGQKNEWFGVLLAIAGQLCCVLGAAGESFLLEQIGLVVSLYGVGLAVFGIGAARALSPIALLLLLTLPLPFTLQAMLTIKLQLISTDLGVAVIQLFGIPVYVEGNIIDLGIYKLQVAEACSGLRYLLPLTCISVLVAYLYMAPFWKKALLVVSAAPLTVLINSVRIAITAILVDNFGISMAEGFLHEFEGWLVFLVGVVCLMLEILVLQRFRWSNVEIEPLMERAKASADRHNIQANPVVLGLIAVACVATLAFTSYAAADYGAAAIPSRQPLAEMETAIGGWSGRTAPMDQSTVDLLKATDYYSGDFAEKAGVPPVNLFVAYYDTLSKNAAIHSPRVCLPGSGWEFASFQERPFADLVAGQPGTYNHVIIQKGEQKILMYYWYQQRERATANEFAMKYYLLVDGFTKARKDGALVRVLTPITDQGEAVADARLHAFVQSMSPKLSSFIPR